MTDNSKRRVVTLVLQEIRRRQVEIDTARGVQPEVTAAMGRLMVSTPTPM